MGSAFPENGREKIPHQADAINGYRKMTVDEFWNDPEIEAVTVGQGADLHAQTGII